MCSHDQLFMRGHTAEVTAIRFSSSGKYVISGQALPSGQNSAIACVFIWDFETKNLIYKFDGHVGDILAVDISKDEKFVATSGEDSCICIWDMEVGQLAHKEKTMRPCFTLCWAGLAETDGGRRAMRIPRYVLLSAFEDQVRVNCFDFDVRTMQFSLTYEVCQLPASGLHRSYISCVMDPTNTWLYLGTLQSDICIFQVRSKVFKNSVRVCSSGVTSLTYHQGMLVAGGGDGSLTVFRADGMSLEEMNNCPLEGAVGAQSIRAETGELLVGTSAGRISLLTLGYNLSEPKLLSEAPTAGVSCVSFGAASDRVCSVSLAGEIRVWDLSDYASHVAIQGNEAATAVCYAENGELIIGFESGIIRCYDTSRGQKSWEVLAAHKGGVSALWASDRLIASGGREGTVCVWTRKSHELVLTINEHKKPITGIIGDNIRPEWIHTTCEDRMMTTYDLKQERRAFYRMADAPLLCLTQKKTGDNEVIVGDVNGIASLWDCDYPDCRGSIQASPERVTALAISPSGKYVAVGGSDGAVTIFPSFEDHVLSEGVAHSGVVASLCWAPDERQLVSGGMDGCLCVWNFYG